MHSYSRNVQFLVMSFRNIPQQLSGMGLALIGTTVEQDAAYWECHIEVPDSDEGTAYEVMFGVATKKDRKFYDALAEQEEGTWRLSWRRCRTACDCSPPAYFVWFLLSYPFALTHVQRPRTQMVLT